jgi:bifunctional non-homologous end joining protein LigD
VKAGPSSLGLAPQPRRGGSQWGRIASPAVRAYLESRVAKAEDPTADELSTYRSKRDPRITNEPFGVGVPTPGGTWSGDFVVHLHAATRRHYDLRLQVGSVLKSFAVPRGPALDPEEKRLAVQTEDHPFAYLDFEDVIPEGQYGAGPMIVWDIGRVRYLENSAESGVPKGKLDFELYGRKLRGRFALVETTQRVVPRPKQRQWLLLKKQDRHCHKGADAWVQAHPWSVLSGLEVEQLKDRKALEHDLIERARQLGAPEGTSEFLNFVPMLASAGGAGLQLPERLYEFKLDGVRILGERKGGQVRLKYRKPNAVTLSYPDIQRALATLFASDFLIDGEIVTFDAEGKPNFPLLAPRIAATKLHDVRRAVAEVPVTYIVFDLLRLGPYDLTGLPLIERKRLLESLVPGKGLVRYSEHLLGNGQPLFELAERTGLEGVVSKLARGRYIPGPGRSQEWVKHKCRRVAQFVVVGWVEGKGSRSLGALELASFADGQLRYRGRVGGGLSDAMLDKLAVRLGQLSVPECPIQGPVPVTRGRHWVTPKWVIEIEYLEWTPQGNLRMPIFKALRDDLLPEQCTHAPPEDPLEQQEPQVPAADGGYSAPLDAEGYLAGLGGDSDSAAELDPAMQLDSEFTQGVEPVLDGQAPASLTGHAGLADLNLRRVQLSNVDKVFWPEEGYTKGDLLEYYARIANVLLPHLEDRPVMLVRYPDGIKGKNFYQWNVPQGTPDWVRTLELRHEERDGKQVSTFLVEGVESLLHVINLGCIPLHVLACRKDDLECCDFLTIDIDLGGRPFSDAIPLALGLKELLDEVGLRGFPKTSGQSGLHVLVALGPRVPFVAAKMLTELLGVLLQSRFSELATVERRISERGGRVYIDTGQTGRSRTIVAPYSVRAFRGATVSTPLLWEELHLALRPEVFTMFAVPERVAERGDPMRELYDCRPDIVGAVQKLERWARR